MPKHHIAVVGSGISGLVTAHLLSDRYDVTLFEANNCLGGHTHTVPVFVDNTKYNVDTGFIVFNKKTYPNFCKLLDKLKIPIQKSEMSFSYRSDFRKVEYNGSNLNKLFADRHNLHNWEFYKFVKEIMRFNKEAKRFIKYHPRDVDFSVKQFIESHHYSEFFTECYFIPMMSSIWSKKKGDTLFCSAYTVLDFYQNHGLLDIRNRPQWYVLENGSSTYILHLVQNIKHNIHVNTKVESIERNENQVIIKTAKGEFKFDAVVIAAHSDQALAMLEHPSDAEIEVLSAIKYTENEVILHTDPRLMPKAKRAWASWNYFDNNSHAATLTYYMNRLQSLKSSRDFFVSVNLTEHIDEEKIIKKITYAHPCLVENAIKAQRKFDNINGRNHTYFAGSYWGHGFHEDGVNSAIRVCESLDAKYGK